jgi:hypothetical protein
VRAQLVVGTSPPLDDLTHSPEVAEHALVRTLVAQLAVERFDKAFCTGLPSSM